MSAGGLRVRLINPLSIDPREPSRPGPTPMTGGGDGKGMISRTSVRRSASMSSWPEQRPASFASSAGDL